jgi:threonine dehydrogenase-like Zn-dependent dehydrogenase
MKMLAAHGLKVMVVGTEEDTMRLDMALKYGAHSVLVAGKDDIQQAVETETGGKGVALAIECAGAEASVVNCMNALMPLGQYVQVGHFGKDLTVPWDLVAFRQLRIHGSVGYTKQTWRRTMKILGQQAVDLSDVITHRLGLDDWYQAFELMWQKRAIKILLNPE